MRLKKQPVAWINFSTVYWLLLLLMMMMMMMMMLLTELQSDLGAYMIRCRSKPRPLSGRPTSVSICQRR